MRRLKTLASALVVALVVIASLDYTASAATGHSFILGKINKANKVTVLKRTTAGSALQLTTKSASNAPLSTNGQGKVANLNADKVDGLDSSAFARQSDATRAYAPFAANGIINPSDLGDPVGGTAHGLAQANETTHSTLGTYCFHPAFAPKSAVVSPIGDLGVASTFFTVATVTVRTNHGLSGCGPTDTVRVRMYDIPSGATYAAPTLANEPFILWLK